MLSADFRSAFRSLRLCPGSSAAVILTLALAIAANSTLFTLIDAALLAPLPVRDAQRLVNVYTTQANGNGLGGLSYPDYRNLLSSIDAFEGMLGYSGLMVTANGETGSEVVFGEIVTSNYFSVLGVQPALGRGFDDREATRGASPAIVIGDGFWRRRFGADPAVVGRSVTLNGRPYMIVGVAPQGFAGLLFRALAADVWVPVSMMGQVRADQLDNRDERWLFVKARLKPTVSSEQAAAASRVIASRLERAYPLTNTGRGFRVIPSSDVLVHPEGDRAVVPVALGSMLAAGLVLVVACANLAGVMLARGLSRRREVAIRLAIGARRVDVVRQLILESAVLSTVGGAIGLLLAFWTARALAVWRPDLPVPLALNLTIDWRVTGFTIVLTAAATAIFGLFPALRTARTPAAGSMTAAVNRRRRWIGARDALLVPQVAIALTLVVVANLFTRSLLTADRIDAGVDLQRTAFVSLSLSMSGYDDERARQFYERLSATLQHDGVAEQTALTDRLPLDLYGNQSATIAVGDRFDTEKIVQVAHVGTEYFGTMGIRLLHGRGFNRYDERGDAPGVVVSAAAAARFWPGRDAIGQEIRVAGSAPTTVIGVASDAKVQTLGELPQPFVYLPLGSGEARLLRMVVRTTGDPRAAAVRIREQVRRLDPAVAVFEARSMADNLGVMLYPYKLAAAVSAALGLLTLALAGVGLYGVIACGVTERTRELAIRLALGAGRPAIVHAAMSQTLRSAAIGIIVGGALSVIAGRLLTGLLFGITPYDPAALIASSAIFAAVVLISSASPLGRACRLAPMSILRQ